MTQRDCEHGQLARSCLICELQAEVEALKAKLAAVCEAVEEPRYQRKRSLSGHYEVANQRGTQGHDAKGRLQYDPRSISYTGSDRRRAQRRKV